MSEVQTPPTGASSHDPRSEDRGAATGPTLEARGIEKSFVGGDGRELRILQGVDLSVSTGEAIAITGASGAGKSTLLHLLGGLDHPTAGRILVGGREIDRLADEDLAAIRNRQIGFVFQFHHLLREFTALENVMMPALVGGSALQDARSRASTLLDEVGLADRASHKPRQLSGGEQQRVAVARALINRPLVLLADEPSGNLDTETSQRLHDLLFHLREHRQLSLVIVTHNLDLAARADRRLVLEAGRLLPLTSG